MAPFARVIICAGPLAPIRKPLILAEPETVCYSIYRSNIIAIHFASRTCSQCMHMRASIITVTRRAASDIPMRYPMPGFLAPYRVLDLSNERGLLCGHMLAQLGADVVQVEPPGGSSARREGPFTDDGDSLYWAAFASGKRSIVCDLDTDAGRATLQRLLRETDFLIESCEPGELAARGFSVEAVRALNPALIHVSITPFGSAGPKASYAATDITVWAAGGPLLPSRDGARPPLRISVPQAFLNAAADAAAGALIAHMARLQSGRGQHVDVSAQQCAALSTLATTLAAPFRHEGFSVFDAASAPKKDKKKELDLSGSGSRTRRSKWQVKDGLVEMHLGIGPASGRFTNNLFRWLHSENACDADIATWDWVALPQRILADEITEDDLERARNQVADFLARFTKNELMQIAMERTILCAPIATTRDLLDSPQLAARQFYEAVTDAKGRTLTLPGRFAAGVDAGFAALGPAPALGAHTQAVIDTWTRERKTSAPVASGAGDAPLNRLKVLDLAWVVAGPVIGRALADFGATVIRVESSKRIETARMMGPFPDGKLDPQRSGLFENCNAGKLGLTLNLASEEGRAVVRDLVKWADVVIESFSPGQMQSWGLGYAQLRELNPQLIMLSTSLMGQTGPWANFAGYGNVGAAVSGYQAIVGWPDALPCGPFGPYTDFVGPRFSLVSLLAALDHRDRTGAGCWLDVSQAEAGIQFLAPQIADCALSGRVVTPQGNRDPAMAPHGVFPCLPAAPNQEGWVAIAARSDDEWQRLAQVIGGNALEKDARFIDCTARKHNEDALEAIIAAWTQTQSPLAIEARLQQLGIPAHNVASSADMVADPQLQLRQHFVSLPHALMGTTHFESARYQLDATPARYQRPAPHFGRDNTYVLSEVLGYDSARIAALNDAGILA
jgi:crotonobetainyl-CoA:carnitine CoA-transferase CaiB-like acyl-CoA transferase